MVRNLWILADYVNLNQCLRVKTDVFNILLLMIFAWEAKNIFVGVLKAKLYHFKFIKNIRIWNMLIARSVLLAKPTTKNLENVKITVIIFLPVTQNVLSVEMEIMNLVKPAIFMIHGIKNIRVLKIACLAVPKMLKHCQTVIVTILCL